MRFVVVYQREPHARQMAFRDVPQPTSFAERAALAQQTLHELQLDVDVWIDDEGDQSRALFGDLPHAALVLDRVGTVQLKLSWCDPTVLSGAIGEVPEMSPAKTMAPVEHHFLTRIANGAELEAHHRATMLAHLVLRHREHDDRQRWLDELSEGGPAQQRAWAQRQRER